MSFDITKIQIYRNWVGCKWEVRVQCEGWPARSDARPPARLRLRRGARPEAHRFASRRQRFSGNVSPKGIGACASSKCGHRENPVVSGCAAGRASPIMSRLRDTNRSAMSQFRSNQDVDGPLARWLGDPWTSFINIHMARPGWSGEGLDRYDPVIKDSVRAAGRSSNQPHQRRPSTQPRQAMTILGSARDRLRGKWPWLRAAAAAPRSSACDNPGSSTRADCASFYHRAYHRRCPAGGDRSARSVF